MLIETKQTSKLQGYKYGINQEYFKEFNISIQESHYIRDQKDILEYLYMVGLIWKEANESDELIISPLLTNFLYGKLSIYQILTDILKKNLINLTQIQI